MTEDPTPIAALSVRSDAQALLTRDLAAFGLDVEVLAEGALAKVDAAGRPAALAVTQLYARAVVALDDPCLGLRLGATRDLAWLGEVGQALTAAPSLRAALEIARRYVGLLCSGQQLLVSEQAGRCRVTMRMPEGLDPVGAAVMLQSTTVLTANVIAELAAAEPPTRLGLACPCPRDVALVDALRRPGRTLEFDVEAFVIELPTAFMAASLGAAIDPELRELLAKLEAERAALRQSQALDDRLRELLLADLAHDPSLDDASRGLGMAPRTLQAHLAQRQSSFQAELDRVREHVAARYLAETNEPVGAIAARLGFSTTSVLSRFFRRATGLSPRAYRTRFRTEAGASS